MSTLRRKADAMIRAARNDGLDWPPSLENFSSIVAMVVMATTQAHEEIRQAAEANDGQVGNQDVWRFILSVFLACEMAARDMERLDASNCGLDPTTN